MGQQNQQTQPQPQQQEQRSERDQKVASFCRSIKLAHQRGDMDEVDRIRQEFYALKSDEARARGDMLQLALLAAGDEAARANLPGAHGVLSVLLMFYEAGREPFDQLCGAFLGPSCKEASGWIIEMVEVGREAADLLRENGSNGGRDVNAES